MKVTVLLAAGTLAFSGLMAPEAADAALGGLVLPPTDTPQAVADSDLPMLADRGRGRGRGRGGDDDGRDDDDVRDDMHDDDSRPGSGSGRSKPRIPGGSGCDDPGDIAEHAGCSG
jgi:ribonuclease E